MWLIWAHRKLIWSTFNRLHHGNIIYYAYNSFISRFDNKWSIIIHISHPYQIERDSNVVTRHFSSPPNITMIIQFSPQKRENTRSYIHSFNHAQLSIKFRHQSYSTHSSLYEIECLSCWNNWKMWFNQKQQSELVECECKLYPTI